MVDNFEEVGSDKPEAENKHPLNILLVEDQMNMVPIIERALKGHNVTSLASAEEALDALRKGALFDWIITDKRLAGEMDGFGLADYIKKEHLGDPYVTMLTGSAIDIRKEHTADGLLQKGINQLIDKPLNRNDLTNSVQNVRDFMKQFQNLQTQRT